MDRLKVELISLYYNQIEESKEIISDKKDENKHFKFYKKDVEGRSKEQLLANDLKLELNQYIILKEQETIKYCWEQINELDKNFQES